MTDPRTNPPVDPWDPTRVDPQHPGQHVPGQHYVPGQASVPPPPPVFAQQPAYPQQAQQPAPPGAPPYVFHVSFPEPKPRKWPWVLGVFLLLSLICCGVCASLVAPIVQQYPTTVIVNDQVAGLTKDQTPLTNLLADEVAVRIQATPGVDGGFAALLKDPGSADKQVILFGATRLVLDPAKELDGAIRGMSNKLSNVTVFDPGTLGGELRCADGRDEAQNKPVVICAWMDHGSVGIGLFYGDRGMADSAKLLRDIRLEVTHRPNS